jgi:hypothetical protein
MAGMFGGGGLTGFTNTTLGSQSGGGDDTNVTTQNYLWKTSSYQLQNSEKSLVVNATTDNIIITLPAIETANDGQSHFVGNLDRSTKSITVSADCNIEDSSNSITLEAGTGYEFVLNKTEELWVPFSR